MLSRVSNWHSAELLFLLSEIRNQISLSSTAVSRKHFWKQQPFVFIVFSTLSSTHASLTCPPLRPLKLNCSSYLSAFFNCTPVCFSSTLERDWFFFPSILDLFFVLFCFDCCLNETESIFLCNSVPWIAKYNHCGSSTLKSVLASQYWSFKL